MKNKYYNILKAEYYNTCIELETDDNFWSILIEESLKNAINSLNFFNIEDNTTSNNFRTIYYPKYGNIIYINKTHKNKL